MAQWCAAFADSDSTVKFDGEMVTSGPLTVDLATCTGTTEGGGEKEGGGNPGLISAPDVSVGIKMGATAHTVRVPTLHSYRVESSVPTLLL